MSTGEGEVPSLVFSLSCSSFAALHTPGRAAPSELGGRGSAEGN